MNLANLVDLFAKAGVTRLYAKELAENDNSKNQIYFAGSVEALNAFPSYQIFASNTKKGPTFKAHINFGWLQSSGEIAHAPNAKLILYSQYPEVRFSGFIQGCDSAPSKLLMDRGRARKATDADRKNLEGRILFVGTTNDRKVVGFLVSGTSEIAREFQRTEFESAFVVFKSIKLPQKANASDARSALIAELTRIGKKGWIASKQLAQSGEIRPCNAQNCGGFTLEAELGIPKNSESVPDFRGWEVKQHKVSNFERLTGGAITLMTPEPTGGLYKEQGVESFIREYGYPDKHGRPSRLNFGGVHKIGVLQNLTNLTMQAIGYDSDNRTITDADGCFALVDEAGNSAATWAFASMFEHWSRKHANAAYVPSMSDVTNGRKYQFGNKIRLASGTDSLKFIDAFASGAIFYDPGIKLENMDTRPQIKRRSQFRVKSADIGVLYNSLDTVTLF